jgi:uncharacterized membrane protein
VRKWLPALPILIGLAASASVYGNLPADVRPEWSNILPFVNDEETMPRAAAVGLVPVIAILLWGALAWGARVRGKTGGAYLSDKTDASAIARFEPTFDIVVTAVVGLVILIHFAILGTAAGWPPWTAKLLGVVLGAGMAASGNLMPRVRPNWIVGIRTRATLADPGLWLRTHRYFGMLLMAAGCIVAIVAMFASKWAFVAAIAGILLASLLAHLFARPKHQPITAH